MENNRDPFSFGKNWKNYLASVDEQSIDEAISSIVKILKRQDLNGLTLLDAGSGSGLFSLAANRMDAIVTSFDVDPFSVECTTRLMNQFGKGPQPWEVRCGSLTDDCFMGSLGEFDIVYCWGVAHHTRNMWKAIENLLPRVRAGGKLVLAIYNDQQHLSRAWYGVKRVYQRLPKWLRPLWVATIGVGLWLNRAASTLIACMLRALTLRNPFTPILNWFGETRSRGMRRWYDLVDWVGGWPFEVAKPEAIFRYCRDRGFVLEELTTCQGHGCNEFVFIRDSLGMRQK